MALSDQERADLKKLTQDELIDVLDGYREDAERQRKADKEEIIKRFLSGDRGRQEDVDEEDVDLFDLHGNEAFKRLKQKYM